MDITKLEKLRPVGQLEQYSTARHPLKFYINAAVSATYTLPDTPTLPVKDYIYRACEKAIRVHPILSAIPVGEDTKEPYFARLPDIDLQQSITFRERQYAYPERDDEKDVELEALLNVQHNTPFTAPLPYWRLCILLDKANERRFTGAFMFHHAIGDGMSGKAFHKTFLDGLQDATESPLLEARRVVPSPATPLLPNVEAVYPMPLSISYLATTLFKEKIWSPPRDPGLWTGSEIKAPLTTRMQHIVIPKFLATSLKNSCRRHNTTITGALQVIIARSFFTHLPITFSKLQCSGAMSTRRWLPDIITDDSMGVWIQTYDEDYARNDLTEEDTFPWTKATQSRQTIENVLSQQGKDTSTNLLKYVSDFCNELFLSKIGKPRGSSFEMSNVGIFTSPADTSRSQVGRMLFSQSASVTGSAVEVSVISGGDGCLVMAFSWQEEVVEAELVEKVIATTEKELRGISGLP